MTQLRIRAVYMRGGTSKGVFFITHALPGDYLERDRILLRVIGSPDRYGKHIDGMGGATSSTSKVALISKSSRPGFDVDFLFGAVSLDHPVIDWSGNCGNLTAAVGPFAISEGLVTAPSDGVAIVRIWQANINKAIIAHVPMQCGEVQEMGDFELDGVAFPGALIKLEFIDPADDENESKGGGLFPTGHVTDVLEVPRLGKIEATLINAGMPSIIVEAASLGLKGTELQAEINGNSNLIALAEAIRARGAVAMGLATTTAEATQTRPASPKLALVERSATYTASDGRRVDSTAIDVLVRIFSMGQLHHAMPGTGAVALATAAAIPGTIVHRVARAGTDGRVCFGHPSGRLCVGVDVFEQRSRWIVRKVSMDRSARRLMEGWVFVPMN